MTLDFRNLKSSLAWPLVLCLGLVLAAGCKPLKRHGGTCDSSSVCASGLECSDGFCHRPEDRMVRGLAMVIPSLPRRVDFPKVEKKTPKALASLFSGIIGKVSVDFFEIAPLPAEARLSSGEVVYPVKAKKALRDALELLAKNHKNLSLEDTKVIPPILADRLDLQVLTSQDGVPIILGAHLRVGELRESIGIVAHPKDVDYALGNALWRLKLKQDTRLGVAFACIGGAYCPSSTGLPEPREGEWPEPVAKALARVEAPFASFRAEVKEDLATLRIHPFTVEAYDPIDKRARVLVIAGATRALTEVEDSWLKEKVAEGVDLVVLAPAARLRATGREFVPVGTGELALLSYLGVEREHGLLVDRSALLKYAVAGGPGGTVAALPLASEISRVEELHPAISGMAGQLLPLAGTFTVPRESSIQPLAWTRAAAVPVRLPASATEAAIREAAPPRGTGARPGVVALTREHEGTRQTIVGSGFGLMQMSARKLLARLDLQERAKKSSVEQLVGDLAAYERAAQAYADAAAANRSLRRGALKVLASILMWQAEPPELRGLLNSGSEESE